MKNPKNIYNLEKWKEKQVSGHGGMKECLSRIYIEQNL